MSTNHNLETINLEAIQKQVHRTVIEDGLLDIMIGVFLILSSFHLMNRAYIFNYLWLSIATVLIEFIRRRFVYPRTGYVKISFSVAQIAGMLGLTVGVMILLVALIALIAAGIGQPVTEHWREILTLALIVFTVIFFCYIAYRFKVPRWYMHGVMLGGGMLLGRAFNAHGILIALGVWIVFVGGYVFFRFIQRFPLQSSEDTSNAR